MSRHEEHKETLRKEAETLASLLDSKDYSPWARIKEAANTKWVIEGVLARGQVGLIYGAPASFKSFIALDIGLSVASGKDWQGRATDEGFVAYVAAEGGDDVAVRQGAWLTHHKIEGGLLFQLIQDAPLLSEGVATACQLFNGIKSRDYIEKSKGIRGNENLLESIKRLERDNEKDKDLAGFLTEELKAALTKIKSKFDYRGLQINYEPNTPTRLIIIDTYAATSEGDTREYWNKYIRGIKTHMPKDAAVLIIDHATKSGDSYMGTLGKQADVDFMAVVKRKAGAQSAKLSVKGGAGKVKSAPEFDDIGFSLIPQEIKHDSETIIDAYGRPLRSLVAVPYNKSLDSQMAPTPLAGKPKLLFDLWIEPADRDTLKDLYIDAEEEAGIKKDSARRSFNRALSSLIYSGHFLEEENLLYKTNI